MKNINFLLVIIYSCIIYEELGINTDISKAQVITKDKVVEQIDTKLHTDLLNETTRNQVIKEVDVSDMDQVYNALGYEMNHHNPSNPYVYNKYDKEVEKGSSLHDREEQFTGIGRKPIEGKGNSFYEDVLLGSSVLETGNSKYDKYTEEDLDFAEAGWTRSEEAINQTIYNKLSACNKNKKCENDVNKKVVESSKKVRELEKKTIGSINQNSSNTKGNTSLKVPTETKLSQKEVDELNKIEKIQDFLDVTMTMAGEGGEYLIQTGLYAPVGLVLIGLETSYDIGNTASALFVNKDPEGALYLLGALAITGVESSVITMQYRQNSRALKNQQKYLPGPTNTEQLGLPNYTKTGTGIGDTVFVYNPETKEMVINKVGKTGLKPSVLPSGSNTIDLGFDIIGKRKEKDLPLNVQNAFQHYESVEWRGNFPGQTAGTKAGKVYRNLNKKLPIHDSNGNPITYKEYDINNKNINSSRDQERFVRGSDGSIYYTDNHYGDAISPTKSPDFTKIK